MSVKVLLHPARLSWALFKSADSLPSDELAHTAIKYTFSQLRTKKVDDQFMLADTVTLTISPVVRLLKGTDKTDDLLAHEQGHYNIGILVGRALAREAEQLTADSAAELTAAVSAVFSNHRLTLMPVVQQAYDSATDSSLNASEQARWNGLIAAALALPAADTLDSNAL